MDERADNLAGEVQAMRERLDSLESENQRLREQLEPIIGPDNPCFNRKIFTRVIQRTFLMVFVPIYILSFLIPMSVFWKDGPMRAMTGWRIGPIPAVDIAGMGTRHPGVGCGIIAFGGAALGVISVGGLGVGILAIGGGAVGVIAVGGGSVGLIALGGGAFGYIAMGGGACGYYTLGNRAAGKFVLALNRQDPEAIDFFARFIPGLRAAVTTAMPVISIEKHEQLAEAASPDVTLPR